MKTTYPMMFNKRTEDWCRAAVAVLNSGITDEMVRSAVLDKFSWFPNQQGYGLGRTPLVSVKVARLLKEGWKPKMGGDVCHLTKDGQTIRTHREHVYGRAYLKKRLWALKNPTIKSVWEVYRKYAVIVVITEDEGKRMSKMGKDKDVNGLGWSWYKRAKISTTILPITSSFLTENGRKVLKGESK